MQQENVSHMSGNCCDNSNQKSICLVDGSGYIFRAFYALPIMTREDGTPVNAVYGFMNMLMNLVSENRCSHIVVVFDAKRKNYRNDIFAAYKENRKETPPELVPQFPLIREASDVLNIPWIEMEGYEADDLIATYAHIATQQGWHTTVVSADKDLMQLMNENVSLYDPMKKKIITNEDVLNKFGVLPNKVTDVQSLMGDSTDNIPGATGIGPKTAASLINEFGSLENLLNNINQIKNEKRRTILERDKKQILISQKLVTLCNTAPVETDLSIYQAKTPDLEKIKQFLVQNRFKSLLNKIESWSNTRSQLVDAVSSTQNSESLFAKTSEETTPLVEESISETTPSFSKSKYELIQDEKELFNWVEKIKKSTRFAIDTETTSLNILEAKLVGISLAIEGEACYIPVRHGGDEEDTPSMDLFSFSTETKKREKQIPAKIAVKTLLPLLKDKSILKIGHNLKYDLHILAKECEKDFDIQNYHDTMVLSYVLNGVNHGHGMDELALLYLNHTTIKYEDVCGTGKDKITFDQVPLDKALDYAAEDADVTLKLYEYFAPKLQDEKLKNIYYTVDLPLVKILFQMEEKGIQIDTLQLNNLKHIFSQELNRLTGEIYALADEEFNINSPMQLGHILFEKMGLSGGKKNAKGAYSTDVKVLETLAQEGHEIAKTALEYRSFSKLKSTYVDSLLTLTDKENRVHTSYMQTVTSTGRLSSTDPNLQNIPIKTEAGKEIRKAFVAKKGYKIVAADYSQIELRLMADVADVKNLKASFMNNEDIHARTASQIFNVPLDEVSKDLRRNAKAINFGIIYGMSAFGLSNQLGISKQEAGNYINAYFKEYPEIKTYMEETTQFATTNGYVLTPLGRKCFIRGILDPKMKGLATRAAINAPIQGGAADIIKIAMQKVVNRLKEAKMDASLLLQVHDELVLEVKEEETQKVAELLKETMENAVQISIPLVVEVGIADNWKDAH